MTYTFDFTYSRTDSFSGDNWDSIEADARLEYASDRHVTGVTLLELFGDADTPGDVDGRVMVEGTVNIDAESEAEARTELEMFGIPSDAETTLR